MRGKTFRNIFLALFLSLGLAFLVVVFYTFSPIFAVLGLLSSAAVSETGGIVAVAGGVSQSFLNGVLMLVPVLFLIFFTLLQNRTEKK